jgi:hypothetical protein
LVAVGIIPTKVAVFFVSLGTGVFLYGMYDTGRELTSLRQTKLKLEKILKEKNRHVNNQNLVCAELDDPMGELVQLDCGESFAPRYATCACTLWCLDEYSFIINNLSPEDCAAAKAAKREENE